MLVEKGYKQTEVGVIPEDWKICEFQDVMTGFSSGQTPYREIKKYYKGEIPWITSGELNYNIITDTFEKITPEAVSKTNLKIIPKGTFLFAITGLEAAGTRGSCGITGIEATTNQSCMALYPIKEKLITEFLYHYYVKNGDLLAFKYCQGTKQQSYTAAIAKKLPIALPSSITEQTAIANALSDMDALIAQTEKLIEKKKAIKQGVMQELLKPKEGWVTKKLGDYGKTYGGITGKTKSDFGKGNGKYIPFMNIMSNPIIDIGYLDKVDIKSSESQNRAIKGDLFFNGSSETPEEVGLCSVLTEELDNLYLNSFCFGYRMNNQNDLNGLFLSYLFRSPLGRNLIFSLAQGATRYNLSKTNLLKLELPIPSKKEQDIIALTLQDLDRSIIATQTKLTKLKHQKQGMMQALLTGKIRLI